MTSTDKVYLSGSCSLSYTSYDNIGHKDVCLEYTEHSSDHWHSDNETSIDINAGMAAKIVALLVKAYPEIAHKTLTSN